MTAQGKNIYNLKHTCPMDRCPKKLPTPLQKLHAQTFRFPGNMQRCVWLEKFLVLKDRRKYMPAGPVQQKSTCPQSKLTCPGHSGSVMFLPCSCLSYSWNIEPVEPDLKDPIDHINVVYQERWSLVVTEM